jgi:hypothetical protein
MLSREELITPRMEKALDKRQKAWRTISSGQEIAASSFHLNDIFHVMSPLTPPGESEEK